MVHIPASVCTQRMEGEEDVHTGNRPIVCRKSCILAGSACHSRNLAGTRAAHQPATTFGWQRSSSPLQSGMAVLYKAGRTATRFLHTSPPSRLSAVGEVP